MRKIKEQQMKCGEVDIATIEFDLRSRDEIPKLLMGLRHIYYTPELREEVFKILLQRQVNMRHQCYVKTILPHVGEDAEGRGVLHLMQKRPPFNSPLLGDKGFPNKKKA